MTTQVTPGSSRARNASTPTTRAWACGERSVRPCSIPGSSRLRTYSIVPVTRATASTIGRRSPKATYSTRVAAGFGSSGDQRAVSSTSFRQAVSETSGR